MDKQEKNALKELLSTLSRQMEENRIDLQGEIEVFTKGGFVGFLERNYDSLDVVLEGEVLLYAASEAKGGSFMVWIENKAPFQGCVYKGTLVHHPEANQLFPLEEAVKGTLGELGFSCFYESSSISKEDVDIMAGVGVGVLKKSSFSKIAFNLEREGHSCLCLVYPLIEEEGVVKYVVHVESLGIKETRKSHMVALRLGVYQNHI
jgi:hypothetical protein